MKLVLPLPEVPIKKTNSPGLIVREISLRMVRSPYAREMFLYCMTYRGKILRLNDFEVLWKFPSVIVIFTVCLPGSSHTALIGNTNRSPLVAFCTIFSSTVTDISLATLLTLT